MSYRRTGSPEHNHPVRPLTLATSRPVGMTFGRHGRGRGIRTPDPLLPKQVRYQTALCPGVVSHACQTGGAMIRTVPYPVNVRDRISAPIVP